MSRRIVLLIVATVIAAAGAGAVFFYVQNVEDQAAAGQEQVEVLVATGTVPVGQSATQAEAAGAFELQSISAESAAPGALSTIEPVAELSALATIYAGEQVLEQKFGELGSAAPLPIPDGKIAVSVQLSDPARVAGFVGPGSDVSVFVTATPPTTPEDGAAPEALTTVLLPRVPVIAAGQTTTISRTTTENGQETTEEIPLAILTLAVDQNEAQKIVQGQSQGELYFGLLDDTSEVVAGSVTTFGDLLTP